MSSGFDLDARLAVDTVPLGDLPLSRVVLMDDARYPWLILVPRRAGLVEVTDLTDDESFQLMREMRHAGAALQKVAPHDKLNIGALGNIVRQLHVHVVGRTTGDAAGNGPVWGVGARQPYPPEVREALAARLREALSL